MKLSINLEKLLDKSPKDWVKIHFIVHELGVLSEELILFFVGAAFSFPLSIPGFSIPFGIFLFFLGFWLMRGKELWLPKWLREKKISYALLEKIVKKGIWLFSKLEGIVHPRLTFLITHPFFRMVNGFLIMVLALFLTLPIPLPLTNILAAFPILLLSIGMLEEDGLFILLGYIGFFVGLGGFLSLLFALFNLI